MILTWMGTASLLLKSDSTVLAFDPFPGLPLVMIMRLRRWWK